MKKAFQTQELRVINVDEIKEKKVGQTRHGFKFFSTVRRTIKGYKD